VRDPSRQEQRRRGLCEIERIEVRVTEEIADVVQRHQHHRQSAQNVDGSHAANCVRGDGCVRNRSADGAVEPGGHAGLSLLESPDSMRTLPAPSLTEVRKQVGL